MSRSTDLMENYIEKKGQSKNREIIQSDLTCKCYWMLDEGSAVGRAKGHGGEEGSDCVRGHDEVVQDQTWSIEKMKPGE